MSSQEKNNSGLIQTRYCTMAFCSSKHSTYAKDMRVPGLLPGGGVRLPPNYYDLPPVDPKHKAVILYFHYMTTNEAAALSTNEDDRHALLHCSQFAISVFMRKMYGVEIHPDAILAYYCQAKDNVEKAGSRWDQDAAAEIISRQVKDKETFDEITFFVREVKEPLTPSERFFLDKAFKATRDKRRDSMADATLQAYWKGATSSQTRDAPIFADPELRQSHSIDPKTSPNYASLCEFEQILDEAKRYRRPNTRRFNLDD